MAVKIGSLLIRLAVEHGILQEGLARSERDVARTTRAIQKRGAEIADFGKNLSLAVSLPIIGLAAASIKAAQESADALGQVNAALASMGNQAGRTSEQLQQLAGEQMRQSLYDDDQILREVTANLLTFGNVAGEQFDRAQQAALDLATRMNGDLQGATLQIGKALNDPVKGVSALAKAGIQFSVDQKEMIKSLVETGNVAAAQQIILAELERQFGGAAKAARDADPGAALAQSFAAFQEEIGAKLLPLLPPILAGISAVLDAFGSLPEPVQSAVIALGAIAVVVGPIVAAIGTLISAGAGTIAMFVSFKAAIDIGGTLKNLIPMILHFGRALVALVVSNPLLLALAVAIGAVTAAWYYWDDIKPILDRVAAAVTGFWNDNVRPVLTFMKDALVLGVQAWFGMHLAVIKAVMQLTQGVKTWLQDKLGAVLDWVGRKVKEVGQFFYDLYIAVVGNSYVPDMVEGIAAEFRKLTAVMVAPAQRAAKGVDAAMQALAERVKGHLADLYPEIVAAEAKAARIADLFAGERAGQISTATRRDAVRRAQGFDEGPLPSVDKVKQHAEELKETIARSLEGLAQRTEVQTVRIADTFADMARNISSSLRGLADGIKNGDFFDIFDAVLGIVTTLGEAGVFGKKFQGRITSIPRNANGTAFHPGGLMMVGERGPEILQVPRGGRVVPNHELREAGGAGSVTNYNYYTLPSDEFWAQVEGRAAVAALPVAREVTGRAFGRMASARERSLA